MVHPDRSTASVGNPRCGASVRVSARAAALCRASRASTPWFRLVISASTQQRRPTPAATEAELGFRGFLRLQRYAVGAAALIAIVSTATLFAVPRGRSSTDYSRAFYRSAPASVRDEMTRPQPASGSFVPHSDSRMPRGLRGSPRSTPENQPTWVQNPRRWG
jgi:hypothetical protein